MATLRPPAQADRTCPLNERLDQIIARQEELSALMSESTAADPDSFVRLSREYAELAPVVETIEQLRAARQEASDLKGLLDDLESDEDMRTLARQELTETRERLDEIEQKLKIMLLPKDAADEKSAIVEIRAGTGGEEAALFAADLFRMYQRYAGLRGWDFDILGMSETGIGGVKGSNDPDHRERRICPPEV